MMRRILLWKPSKYTRRPIHPTHAGREPLSERQVEYALILNRCLEEAIAQYTSKGSFRRAATHEQNLAECYEVEVGDLKKAIVAYETSAKWFESDGAEAYAPLSSLPKFQNAYIYIRLANKNFLKVAEIAALESDYYKAIELYEKVAAASVNNNAMRWSVKDYFFKSGICLLAVGDTVATGRAFEKYRDMDPTFASTREHQLLVDLSETIAAGEQEAFADKLFQFDQMSKLDKWKTTLLLRVKNAIVEQGDDFS